VVTFDIMSSGHPGEVHTY